MKPLHKTTAKRYSWYFDRYFAITACSDSKLDPDKCDEFDFSIVYFPILSINIFVFSFYLEQGNINKCSCHANYSNSDWLLFIAKSAHFQLYEARTSYFQRYDGVICFSLEKHAKLNVIVAYHWNNNPLVEMSLQYCCFESCQFRPRSVFFMSWRLRGKAITVTTSAYHSRRCGIL